MVIVKGIWLSKALPHAGDPQTLYFREYRMKIRPANDHDLMEVISWFLTETEVKSWGGPKIHFPLSLEQLKIDIEWDGADSYAFMDEIGNLLGFAQVLNKFGYKHLTRIAISPEMRGKKLGYELMTALLNSTIIDGVGFSLFVYKDNIAAKKLYDGLGFLVQEYPDEQQKIKGCSFMVKKT